MEKGFCTPCEKENNKKISFSSNRFSMSNENFIRPAPSIDSENKSKLNSIVKVDCLKKCLTSKKFDYNIPNISFSKTEIKRNNENSEFKKTSEDSLPSISEIIIDDFDKKTFSQISLFEVPKISDLLNLISKEKINSNDFEIYSWISYILYSQKNLDEIYRNIIIESIPINLIDISIDKNDRGVLNMILNCIVFSIQDEINYEILKHKDIKKYMNNLFYIIKKTKHYRIKRKIVGLCSLIFYYDNEILIEYFCDFHNIIEEINLGSVVLIKLYQEMKKKLNHIFHSLIYSQNIETTDKNELEEILENLNVTIQLMSVRESQLILDYDKYRDFRIMIRSTKPQIIVSKKILYLKKKIERIFNN